MEHKGPVLGSPTSSEGSLKNNSAALQKRAKTLLLPHYFGVLSTSSHAPTTVSSHTCQENIFTTTRRLHHHHHQTMHECTAALFFPTRLIAPAALFHAFLWRYATMSVRSQTREFCGSLKRHPQSQSDGRREASDWWA